MIWLFILIIILFIILNLQKKEEFQNTPNSLVVILPLRDRESDLEKYLKNIIPIFKHQKINYTIIIVEQAPGKKFNKGKINNVGFLEALKYNPNAKRFLFNDVDNFPLGKDVINYNTHIKGFHHFFGYDFCLGGFFLTNKNKFKLVNGYSNQYWGWGGEDRNLQDRTQLLNIKIIRNPFVERNNNNKLISDIREKKNNVETKYRSISKKLKETYIKNINNIYLDGLNTCQYKIIEKNINKTNKIIRILVDI